MLTIVEHGLTMFDLGWPWLAIVGHVNHVEHFLYKWLCLTMDDHGLPCLTMANQGSIIVDLVKHGWSWLTMVFIHFIGMLIFVHHIITLFLVQLWRKFWYVTMQRHLFFVTLWSCLLLVTLWHHLVSLHCNDICSSSHYDNICCSSHFEVITMLHC